jgi:hypothetical protein
MALPVECGGRFLGFWLRHHRRDFFDLLGQGAKRYSEGEMSTSQVAHYSDE